MFDPVLKSFLNKHGISEAEFKSYDRTTQDQLSVHAKHGEYNIHDVSDKFDRHEYKEAFKAAFYCAPVETVMTTSTIGFILPCAVLYGLAAYPGRWTSRIRFLDGIRARTSLVSKTRRTRFALLLGSFAVVNSFLLERMITHMHK